MLSQQLFINIFWKFCSRRYHHFSHGKTSGTCSFVAAANFPLNSCNVAFLHISLYLRHALFCVVAQNVHIPLSSSIFDNDQATPRQSHFDFFLHKSLKDSYAFTSHFCNHGCLQWFPILQISGINTVSILLFLSILPQNLFS